MTTAPQNRVSLEAFSQGFSTSRKTKCKATPATAGHSVQTPPQGFLGRSVMVGEGARVDREELPSADRSATHGADSAA
jgi:hypothetical protein